MKYLHGVFFRPLHFLKCLVSALPPVPRADCYSSRLHGDGYPSGNIETLPNVGEETLLGFPVCPLLPYYLVTAYP